MLPGESLRFAVKLLIIGCRNLAFLNGTSLCRASVLLHVARTCFQMMAAIGVLRRCCAGLSDHEAPVLHVSWSEAWTSDGSEVCNSQQ